MVHILFSLHPSQHPFISCVFDNSHSDQCEVIPHSGFDVYFPGDYWHWTSFNVPIRKLYVFEKTFTQFLHLLLNWFFLLLLNCRSSWYVLDINLLPGVRFGNLFMLLCGLFISLWRYQKCKLLRCVWLFATPWTIQSMEFSRILLGYKI